MRKLVWMMVLGAGAWLGGCSQPLEGVVKSSRTAAGGNPPVVNAGLDLTGKVTAPVAGDAPVSTSIDTAQYTGTVAWKESDGTTAVSGNFAALVYQAVITLTAKNGYTFDGFTGTFSHTGATTVGYAARVVTITFPARSFTAQYRDMILATPDDISSVTITGDSAYYYNSSYNYYKGVFIENRTVTLSPFKIAKYETTYELWYEVKQWAVDSARGANRYVFGNEGREGHDGTGGAAPSTGGAKLEPVTYINWRDAVIWCNAYSEMSGKEPVYYTDAGYGTVLRTSTNESGTATAADGAVMKTTANGYRLPTEAEWEYAARGGKASSTNGTFADKWAGTNTESELGNYAWYSGNSSIATHAAGGKMGNTLGLYDMSGNVYEWCWDWYSSSVGTGTVTDPTGAASGSGRVVRGGGWYNLASHCAVSYRGSGNPNIRYDDGGFRVVAP
jgi:formylglycine-generating enzyme required for sulfatase activity